MMISTDWPDVNRLRARPQLLRLACIAIVLILGMAYPAGAHQVATWAGKITYVNLDKVAGYQKVGVNAKQETKTFLIGNDFEGVKASVDSSPRTLRDLTPGMQVKVRFYKDTLFGADKAVEIDIFNGFNLNLMQTPPPRPQ